MEDLTLEQKAEAVNREIQAEKDARLKLFVDDLNGLSKKYNCGLIAQAIIEGDKCTTRITPIAY